MQGWHVVSTEPGAMGIEMEEYVVEIEGSEDIVIDDVVVDDIVLTVDPVEFDPAEFVDTTWVDPVPVDPALVDTLPVDTGESDVPPDAQTFGGPVDGGEGSGEVGYVGEDGDGDVSHLLVVCPVFEGDPVIVDETFVPKDDLDPAIFTTTDFGTDIDFGTPVEGDPVPVDDPVAVVDELDPEIFTTTDFGTDADTDTAIDIEVDPATGGAEENPGRPIDPQPEWRTLTSDETTGEQPGDAPTEEGGIDTTDGDVPPEWAYTDFVPVYDKDPADEGNDTSGDTPPDVYTMDADDPLIYATSGGTAVLPPIDPAFLTPVTIEVEVDRTPVNYAPADSFNTGLDLL